MANRKLVVHIIGDSRSLERAYAKSSKASKGWGRDINRAARGGVVATVGFRGLGRSVAFASGAFLGGAGFVAGARAAIKAASDLGEEVNKTRVLFGSSSGEIRAWSRTTATALGLSQRASLSAAGNFGAMFETLELGDPVAARMSKRLVGLGADLASFANEDPSDMLDRLRSGLAGEAEPLRRFGILLSEARVQQEAYTSGLAVAGAKLTEQQKVLARFNLILKDSAAAQGDFARTSQSQANQERINAALREEAAKRIGQVLLPAYNQATRAINKWLGEEKNLQRIQKATSRALEIGTSVARAFRDVVNTMKPILERVNSLLGGTENSVKLLLAVMVATKIFNFTTAITGLGTEALVARGRVTALRGALMRLGAIGAITIGIELLINRKQIAAKGMDWRERFLESLGLNAGPGTNERVRVAPSSVIPRGEGRPTPMTPRQIRNLRDREAARLAAAEKRAREELASARAKARRLETTRAAEAERKEAREEERRAEEALERAQRASEAAARKAATTQRRNAQNQAQQFRRLGLTAEGQQRVPSMQALKRRLGTLRDQLKGTLLDTPKTQAQLARIAAILRGKFGKVGRDVRAAILQMFADISGALSGDGAATGPQTKARKVNINALLANAGLSENEVRELRSRLSQITTVSPGGRPSMATGGVSGGGVSGGAGMGGFVIHNHIHLDGKEIATSTTRHQQRMKRRAGGSRAGTRPGGGV